MVSAQIAGLVRMYRSTPSGNKVQIMQARIEQLAPAGGASEGATASVSTPEKLLTINSPVVLVNDDVLLVTFTPDATATIGTVTKSIWSVPTVTQSGSSTLGRAQFASPSFAAIALNVNEQVVAGYKVTEGQLRVAGKIYLDIQNNA